MLASSPGVQKTLEKGLHSVWLVERRRQGARGVPPENKLITVISIGAIRALVLA